MSAVQTRWLTWLALALLAPAPLQAQQANKLPPKAGLPDTWIQGLSWRNIGPANMGGRIVAISVYEADPTTYWVATASGGLLKTTNAGISFEHQFDREATVSIGDVCVAPSNPNIVWVGTGENNPRNSVSYGDGVYKSTDGGKTWKNMGLKKTFQIGRILIHPNNPDVVYVGALGRLYGPNEDRGLFKTTDGGKTWEKILFVDAKTGIIDMRMHPTQPDTLLVAAWERQRDGYDNNEPAKRWGPGGGLWKTTDGGKSWKKITRGLPSSHLGRIGLDWYRKDPRIVYAVVDCEKIGLNPNAVAANDAYMGISGEDAGNNGGARLVRVFTNGPADVAGLRVGDILTEIDKKKIPNYQALVAFIRQAKAGDKVKISYSRNNQNRTVELTFTQREGAALRPFGAYLEGQRENVQSQQGANGHEFGGIYRSTDGGDTWTRVNSLNPRPMYFSKIRVDPSDSSKIYVLGIGLHRSTDGGQRFTTDPSGRFHADLHALWIDPRDGRHLLLGTDGGIYVSRDRGQRWDHLNTVCISQFYHVAVDTRRNYRVYGGLQDNGTWGGPSFTRSLTGPINEDWINVGGGDGFRVCVDPRDPDQLYFTSQYGNLQRRNLRTRETARIQPIRVQGVTYRWNWNTPFILSHANSKVYYAAGNYVFRSENQGRDLKAISPEITTTPKGSASALAESPLNPAVLWVGTDDGNLWVTQDGGKNWTNVASKVGLPGLRWVASVEPSRFEAGRCYVAFDAHRSDDDNPYVYVTEDFGKTWKNLTGNLPWGSTRVVREDLFNRDVLYLGTEFGAWASIDRGQTWNRINANLPTVAVHEFAQHPTSGELIAATHGRGIWILDATPLRQATSKVLTAQAHLFKPTSAIRWLPEPARGRTNRRFVGENPPNGAVLYYSLATRPTNLSLAILDRDGKEVRRLAQNQTPSNPGLHRVVLSFATTTGRGRQGGGGGGGQAQQPRLRSLAPGDYQVVLTANGVEYRQPLKIENDPTVPVGTPIPDEDE